MTSSIRNNTYYALTFGLVLLIFGACFIITMSEAFIENSGILSTAITLDLALTTPLLYFLLIRKKPIPKTTIVPIFIAGLVVAGLILPTQEQQLLGVLKTFALPAVELGVIAFLFIKVRQTVQEFRKFNTGDIDFLNVLRSSVGKVFGKGILSQVLASEISVFYYTFFSWKSKAISSGSTFTYHRKGSKLAMIWVFVFLIVAETFILHLLLALWKPWIAWVMSAASIYTVFLLIAHLKACLQRPIIVQPDQIQIRNGLLGDTNIPFDTIELVTDQLKTIEKADQKQKLDIFDTPNLAIKLRSPNIISGPYGKTTRYKTLLLMVDDRAEFVARINQELPN
ncbi:MAG: hypothetical protein ACR2MX_06420 [Cyclobacteriaceae bacterium]